MVLNRGAGAEATWLLNLVASGQSKDPALCWWLDLSPSLQ